jgi:vitamin B12 transporter
MAYRIARALACAVLLTAPAATGEQMVVTATRLSGLSGGNVSLISADRIAVQDPASIVDVLRDLPSVFVPQQGGSVVSIFTRGAKPNFTLVLLDGVKANDPTNTRGGSYDFSTRDVAGIDHIEMVRGPESAIYGSDAVGGVINIVTRQGGAVTDAALTVEGGSSGFVRADGHLGGPIGGATANLGISYRDNGMVDGGNVHGLSLDGALALPKIAGANVSLTGRYDSSIATSFPDSSGGPDLAVLRTLDHRDVDEAVLGAHAHRAITDAWAMTLDYGFYGRWSNATSPGVAPSTQTPTGIPANGDRARFGRNEVTWTNRLDLGAVQAAAGVDMQAEHGVDDGYLNFGFNLPTRFALSRTLWAGFAEARWQIAPAFSLAASGRYDSVGSQDHVSPQLRADYAPLEGTALQLSWGKAYKRPSFYALGNPIVGDPTLKPEDAESLEGGVTQSLGEAATWKVEAYATHYRDLIDFRPGAAPKLVNLSTVHVRGLESEIDWRWDTLTVMPRLSYTDARNTATNAGLRDVPQWLAGAALLWKPDAAWQASFDLSHVGSFTDNAVPTGDVRLGSHVRADLAAGYRLTPNLTLRAGIDNLFDAHYYDAVGFAAPGITLRGGISASF